MTAPAAGSDDPVFVIISGIPLPAGPTGSWPQRVEWLLASEHGRPISHVLTPSPDPRHGALDTSATVHDYGRATGRRHDRIVPRARFRRLRDLVRKVSSEHRSVVYCVIDHFAVRDELVRTLRETGATARSKVVYYHCGFSPSLVPSQWTRFCDGLDRLVFLTEAAYRTSLRVAPALPVIVSVLPNPVRHDRFHPASAEERRSLRAAAGWPTDGTSFVWLGHDRPEKGLDVVLAAWHRWRDRPAGCHLHVIGATRTAKLAEVTFHGRVPNPQLPDLLRAADVGIFSPLRQEGFGLSLAEMISAGCLALASDVGGVPEFFRQPDHGLLIRSPNRISAWIEGFDLARERLPDHRALVDRRAEPPFARYDEWARGFMGILHEVADQQRVGL